ncbi:S1C family serine protease [Chitinophaga filiformis]|uniref:Serine protease, S1-C subfamily, contains C-terminal PDZ domain n=1 Tax=Chitinophaga filiformis TaxID=104663 RepID=A0A1G7QGN4_CHIFI|nr:S1C family serine protease [Chitinophaga filiformis]SDF97717.1 serine protease, S1-C subfamily, contains C-terminal PDZ domain [Chitinophaga filiformis]
MNDFTLIRDIERYLEGEMSEQERTAFEALRQSNPAVNEQVLLHQQLMQQLEQYGQRVAFQEKMDKIHASMAIDEVLPPSQIPAQKKVFTISRRLITNMAAAACIALVTSLSTIALMQNATRQNTTAQYEDVRRVLNNIQRSQNALINDINSKKKAPANPGTYGGTGFAISNNGYVVTNYHVIAGADSIYIQNTKGEAFKAASVFEDISSDLAILKITDSTFKGQPLPYTLKPQYASRGEAVFTLGYPRDEIVYGEGYISAQTGFNGDSAAYQVSIPVNPGNSGAPLMDSKGDVVGIVTGKQTTSDGIAFAVKSAHLKRLLEEMPKDKLPKKEWNHKNRLGGLTRVDQVKKLEEFVYMVKVYN